MWKLKVLILSIISLNVSANRINKDEKLGQVEVSETLSYRLPKNTIPKSYDLTIETKIHEINFDFSGNVKIHVEIVEPTDSITLHSRQLEIDKIDLLLPNSFPIIIDAEFHHIESHDFLIIKLPNVYNASDELILDISYLGNLRDDNAGFYRSSYYNNDSIKWYAATQFQMDDARHALPCFDEPGFRATMKVTLRHGKTLHAISNTDIVEVIPDGDYTVTKFKETPVMPTYLLAFIVTDFGHIIANDSRVPQKIYGRSELIQNGELEIAAGVVGKILDIFESFLPDYPLNKIDHVAVHYPKKVAMENFGLITYDEYLLSLNPISPEKKYSDSINHIVQSISNTFSMQWFGNTVSPKWWQHLWLSEGFAKFFEGYIQYLYYNDRSLMDKHFRSIIYESFSLDSWTDRTMNDYVEHPNELWTKFNSISSIKSACVLRMFMEAMTEDVFIKGLNYYLTDNIMQSVTPAELHASLQKAYNEVNAGNPLHIDTIMSSWEDQAGYPLISVSISGSNLIVSQRRHHANTGETYTVPLTFATKSYPIFTTRTKTWLPLRAMPLQQASIGFAPGDWIILNINQVGYYKVDYDKTLWHAIIDQLKEDPKVINPINREVLQDEFMMAWMEFERVNGGDALSFISYLQKESNPAVWNQAYELLRYLRSNLFGTAVYDEFLKLLQQITKPHLLRLGYEALNNDTSDDTQLRSITKEWNCIAIDGDCVSRDLVQLILFRMNNGAGNFNFCNALKIADRTTYSEILSKVITDSNFDSRNEYIWGLGCSMISQNLESLLNAVLDTNNVLENFERETILNVMASTTNIGLEMSLNFIDEHYMEISELLQYSTMPIIYFANNAKEEKMMDQVENLIVKLLGAGLIDAEEQRFYTALINQNKFWLGKNYYDIKVYFGLEEPTTTVPSTTESTTTSETTVTTSSEPTTLSSSSVPTTFEPTTQPTTIPSTSPQPDPTTTPDSGNSIILSASLIFVTLMMQILRMF